MRRRSIRTLMGFVVLIAIGLAALRNANELWAGLMMLLALAAVGVAILGAALLGGRERAWWLGFAVFAGGYLAVSVGPWVGDAFRQQLITTHWIGDLRHRLIASQVGAWTAEKQALEAELARLKPSTPNFQYDPVVANLTNHLRSAQAALTASRNAGLRYDHFQRVGHCLCILLSGLVGGTVAVWFRGRRERQESSPPAD
ncbi:MAG: hypothetical protein ACLQGP_34635 [Isosphaeraceae bacterium]